MMIISFFTILLAILQLNITLGIRRASGSSAMLHRTNAAIYSTKDASIDNREAEVETPIIALNDSDKRVKRSSLELNALELCLCGAFATAFGDFCVHPIDTIKVTQQAAGTLKMHCVTCCAVVLFCPSGLSRLAFKRILQCTIITTATTLSFIAAMKRIFLTKGPLGFYQGMPP